MAAVHGECMGAIQTVEPDGPNDVNMLRLLCDEAIAGDRVVTGEVDAELEVSRRDGHNAAVGAKVDVEELGQRNRAIGNLEGLDGVVVLRDTMRCAHTAIIFRRLLVDIVLEKVAHVNFIAVEVPHGGVGVVYTDVYGGRNNKKAGISVVKTTKRSVGAQSVSDGKTGFAVSRHVFPRILL